MFNILLDRLPDEWNGYKVDMDFETGILVSQCLSDEELAPVERISYAISLIFPEKYPTNQTDIEEAVTWYLNGWDHDNHKKGKQHVVIMDFDIDQWRIYAAFRKQYGINLNRDRLHFWEFMGLLSNLEECSFTRVIDIRTKKMPKKASVEEKTRIRELKAVYGIRKADQAENFEEKSVRQEAIDEFNRIRRGEK